ncbi:hypothetical protein [Phyllobacterium endophyticum]|uniref:hypothetical protein n=1 Tax=Phyllobacterium endophyticum TaxID=1149773 RepID=UPI000D104B9A|nr:hypothetical protein [Phyllobacterium endophyticum]
MRENKALFLQIMAFASNFCLPVFHRFDQEFGLVAFDETALTRNKESSSGARPGNYGVFEP